ncbi:MAG: Trk system potassium transporter TrkA, partial [Gammaproteobacteria bacterium]
MNIIILGAGQVGASVAENLASEANDITLVDSNSTLLNDLNDRLDIQTVVGHASYPDVLKKAGISDADMLIAVTKSDETNIVACQVAHSFFHTPTKIARVRSQEYLKYKELFNDDALPIDVLISPEQLIAEHIQRLIEYPGALQVLDFAGGRARLVGVKAYYGGPLVGHEIADLRKHIPGVDSRVAAIFRRGKGI